MNKLNDDQERILKEATHWFFNESEQVFQIAGAAGTGKTFLIYEILKAFDLNESQYMAMAYTGQASIVMRTRGFLSAKSIHSSLYELIEVSDQDNISRAFNLPTKKKVFRKRLNLPKEIRLLFIDEAYMVPKRMVQDILSFGIKVIVCGDPNQLPPIGDDPGFLVSGNIHRLTKLMRQAEQSPIVYIANRIINNQPIHCGLYGNQVLVITDDDLIPEMFTSFAQCVCCGTNKTRETLNSNIRSLLGFRGQLPNVGERVICRQNNWDETLLGISLCNGLSGTVVSPPDISKYDGKIFNMDFKPDLINDYFRQLECNIDYFLAPYEIKQEMKNMNKDWITGEFFEFAYCLTTHLCQGSEYKTGIYIEEYIRPQIQKALNYTGITRFKEGIIYVKKKNKYF
jgi:exodeoxyribonuclease-5